MSIPPNWSNQPKRSLPLKPRRVRAGVKLTSDAPGQTSWAAQRWLRLLEQAAEGQRLIEGIEYGRLGQTKQLAVHRGVIEGIVQGRQVRAYSTHLRVAFFEHAQWQSVIEAMSGQAVYVAKLLAGELPANIEDVFIPLGLKLFPTEPGDVKPSCTCGEGTAWCKHACCVAMLFAEKLASDPFLMFTLRGLESEDLLERLRQRRAMASAVAAQGAVPLYVPRIPGVSDQGAPALESCVERFWELGPGLGEVDMPIEPPHVAHPLLRRLGPSPFPAETAKFPLVGLLATCYEIAGQRAMSDGSVPPGESEAKGEAGVSPEAPADGSSTPGA